MDRRERRRRRRKGEWCYTRKQKTLMKNFVFVMKRLGLANMEDYNALRNKNYPRPQVIWSNWAISGASTTPNNVAQKQDKQGDIINRSGGIWNGDL